MAEEVSFASRHEFRVESAHAFNVKSPVRWVISHLLRYPLFPLIMGLAAVANNFVYSYVQIFIGRAFDLISIPGFLLSTLLAPVLGILACALGQGTTGIVRNFTTEFLAQRIERDSRDELYSSLLGKSLTFHGRQRIGDIMARSTNDVRALNLMFSPGLNLIIDSVLALVVPVIMIGVIHPRLLLVPLVFTVLLTVTVRDYNRRLKPVSIAQREQFGIINAGLAEAVAGIEVVKANVRERYEWEEPRQPGRGGGLYGFVRDPAFHHLHLHLFLQPGSIGDGQCQAYFENDQSRNRTGSKLERDIQTHRGRGRF